MDGMLNQRGKEYEFGITISSAILVIFLLNLIIQYPP